MDFGTIEFRKKVILRLRKLGEIIGLSNKRNYNDECIRLYKYLYSNENDKNIFNFIKDVIRYEVLIKIIKDYETEYLIKIDRKYLKDIFENKILFDFASNHNKTFEEFVSRVSINNDDITITNTIQNITNFIDKKFNFKFDDDLPYYIIRHLFYNIIEIEKFEDLTSFINKEENYKLKNEIVKFKNFVLFMWSFGLSENTYYKKIDKTIKKIIIFKFGKIYKDFQNYCDDKENDSEEEDEEDCNSDSDINKKN